MDLFGVNIELRGADLTQMSQQAQLNLIEEVNSILVSRTSHSANPNHFNLHPVPPNDGLKVKVSFPRGPMGVDVSDETLQGLLDDLTSFLGRTTLLPCSGEFSVELEPWPNPWLRTGVRNTPLPVG